MCYLIAKNIDDVGCVALRTTHGKHLSEFKRGIEAKVGYEKIQLVTKIYESVSCHRHSIAITLRNAF